MRNSISKLFVAYSTALISSVVLVNVAFSQASMVGSWQCRCGSVWTLTENGTRVSGYESGSGGNGSINGSLSGNVFRFQYRKQSGITGNGAMTVSGNHASGTINWSDGTSSSPSLTKLNTANTNSGNKVEYPAGWYVDHDDSSIERYWDGQRWTPHTRPKQAPQVAAGWYDDPDNSTLKRYWDGSNWTWQTRPKNQGQQPLMDALDQFTQDLEQRQRQLEQQRLQQQQQLQQFQQQAQTTTQVQVRVYEIGKNYGIPLIWHTGIVVNGVEYSFWPADSGSFLQRKANAISSRGKVKENVSTGVYRKTLTRTVRGDSQHVQNIIDQAKRTWNGTEYAVFKNRNCNHFTDHVLQKLGSHGLDREYLRHSGLRPGVGAVQQTVQDTANKAKKLGGEVARETKKVGGNIAREGKKAGNKLKEKAKSVFGGF